MEALARFVSCSACGESIDENDASTPYTIVKGEHVHLRCSVVTEISAQYAKEVREYLTTGKNATRPATAHPLLDEEETEELLQCYLLSVPAIEFAKRLENRDISDFERASDPYPQREYPEVPMN
jgi:hypothetical protein